MDFDRKLRTYAELAVQGCAERAAGTAGDDYRTARQWRGIARGGAACAGNRGGRLSRRIAARRNDLRRRAQQLIRFKNAPRDSFGNYSAWLPKALSEHVAAGHAVLSISANDPGSAAGTSLPSLSAPCCRRPHATCGRFASRSRATRRTGPSLRPRAPAGPRRFSRACRPTTAVERLWDAIARHVPARRARSACGVGNAPGQPCGAQRVSEREAVFGAEVHRARHRSDARACRRVTSG